MPKIGQLQGNLQEATRELSIAAANSDNLAATINALAARALAYGFDGAAWDRLVSNLDQAAGSLNTLIVGSDGNRMSSYDSQITSVSAARVLAVGELITSGGGAVLKRAVQRTQILASASRTATQNGADRTNINFRAVALMVNVSLAGTGSITPVIEAKDETSGNYIEVFGGTALTTNGQRLYVVSLADWADAVGTPTQAGITEAIKGILPARTFRITITHNNANAITYSVDLIEIP